MLYIYFKNRRENQVKQTGHPSFYDPNNGSGLKCPLNQIEESIKYPQPEIY